MAAKVTSSGNDDRQTAFSYAWAILTFLAALAASPAVSRDAKPITYKLYGHHAFREGVSRTDREMIKTILPQVHADLMRSYATSVDHFRPGDTIVYKALWISADNYFHAPILCGALLDPREWGSSHSHSFIFHIEDEWGEIKFEKRDSPSFLFSGCRG